jgi:hypothetical protein
MKSQLASACVLFVVAGFVPSAFAEQMTCPPSSDPSARGYCSQASGGDSGIVRAKGSVDTATGRITLIIELESDDATAGPCGMASITLRDAAGARLSTVQLQKEACLGGKPTGETLVRAFTYTRLVAPEAAQATTTVEVSASNTRQISRVWSASFEEGIQAIRLVQTVVGAMH